MHKHFSSLCLHYICYFLIGQSKSHGPDWGWCEKVVTKGVDTGRRITEVIFHIIRHSISIQ